MFSIVGLLAGWLAGCLAGWLDAAGWLAAGWPGAPQISRFKVSGNPKGCYTFPKKLLENLFFNAFLTLFGEIKASNIEPNTGFYNMPLRFHPRYLEVQI